MKSFVPTYIHSFPLHPTYGMPGTHSYHNRQTRHAHSCPYVHKRGESRIIKWASQNNFFPITQVPWPCLPSYVFSYDCRGSINKIVKVPSLRVYVVESKTCAKTICKTEKEGPREVKVFMSSRISFSLQNPNYPISIRPKAKVKAEDKVVVVRDGGKRGERD